MNPLIGTRPSFRRRNMDSPFPEAFAMDVCQGFGSEPTGGKGNRFGVAKYDLGFVCWNASNERRGAEGQAQYEPYV